MIQFLLDHATTLRLAIFAGVLAAMGLWEALAPKRSQQLGRIIRWPGNLAIAVIDTLAVRLLIPVTLAGAAAIATVHGVGLFNMLPVPGWAAAIASIILMDLAIYGQHIVLHKVPWLWRLHRMHHADTEFDVTTGLRFHPGEIVVSAVYKLAAIAVLGAPAAAVLTFEIILNASAMFSHGNVVLPGALEATLRRLIVTPDMHRIHHSAQRAETDSNFGFGLSLWDRIFGTYRAEPAAGQLGLTIGLAEFRSRRQARIDQMLTQPFRDGD